MKIRIILLLSLMVCTSFGRWINGSEELLQDKDWVEKRGWLKCYELGISPDKPEGVEWENWIDKNVKQAMLKAKEGDADAQFLLGNCFNSIFQRTGEFAYDPQKSRTYYEQAASQGHVGAQQELASQANLKLTIYKMECYQVGISTNKPPTLSWDDWIKQGFDQLHSKAEGGDAESQYSLGFCYGNGTGVSQDHQEALKWYQSAASQGLASAQDKLARCYESGIGVPKSSQLSAKWYREAVKSYLPAAEQGDINAQDSLANCYDHLGEYRNALTWYRKATAQGSKFSKGMMLLSSGVRELLAEEGDLEAQSYLGDLYYVSKDYHKAVKWLRLAAAQGDADAQSMLEGSYFNLGLRYSNGDGVVEDHKESVKWFRLAAAEGVAEAQCNLGYSYSSGEGVLEDYVEAYAWYLISAMNGSEVGSKNKEILKDSLSNNQITAGQNRAKELLAIIERKQHLSSLSKEQAPSSADIAPSGFGSGLLVNGGYVLTCWHVIDGSQRVAVSVGGKDYVAKVVQKDPANDIAVLKVEGAGAGISLSFSDKVRLGEQIFTMGYPHPDFQGSDVKFTTGSISSLTGLENSPRYFQISVPVQAGNSGGPLFDEHGNLIGIVAAKLDSLATVAMTGDLPQNVNYAIKADYLVPLLKAIEGIEIQPENTTAVNLLELIDELKKSVVMIKVY